MNCHEAGRMLDAYIDDELNSADTAAIAEHIEGCAACRQRLADLESLRRLLRSVPYHAAPTRLRTTIARAPKRARVTPQALAWAAAAAIVVAVAGAAAFRARQTTQATMLLAETVVTQHVSALTSNHLIDVRSTSEHTVKPWFQGKLDFSPPVADLTSAGFPLVGGRVDSIAGRSVAALVYQRRDHVITVFVLRAGDRTSAADARTIRGFQERHWTRADLSLWAVSDLNDRELTEFAHAFESSSR
ncbi:MAG TPA: anti-sigma factor [Vicinamibacterales bacterium]|nr:anti-sigma factor [Vicinamibacterales bacterium]